MYVSPTSARLFGGRSTPATRAIFSKHSPVNVEVSDCPNPQSPISNRNRLPLPLLMFRIDANHSHHALAVNDFALITHLFYGSTDFHYQTLLCVCLNPTVTTCTGR